MSRRVHLRITGRVQGVWYRGAMQAEAGRVGVTGWVRNRPDGSVEAEVQGDAAAVERMLTWAHTGPPAATVGRVVVTDREPGATDSGGFDVRP